MKTVKNLEFISHKPEMLCGIIRREWSESELNYNFLGVPLDVTSTYRSGARHAPDFFRRILQSENFECVSEQGIALKDHYKIKDWGNVGIIPTNLNKSLGLVSEGVSDLIQNEHPFLVFGGDHSITIGIGQAFEETETFFYPIYIDAHLDLYSEVIETKYSHACTLRRISEMNGFQGATVLGYRDFTKNQLAYAEANDISTVSINELLHQSNLFKFGREMTQTLSKKYNHIHVSVDIDVLDPSFAPGVGNPVAGGLSTKQLIWILTGIFHGIKETCNFSWDIVEYNPLFDLSEITGFALLKMFLEGLGAQAPRIP